MTYLQTSVQSTFDLLDPSQDGVDAEDIAHALSLINRFAGRTRLAWSVAAHSVLVACLMARDGLPARLQLYGLLHDAHEAFTGDLSTPLKQAFEAHLPGFQERLRAFQGELDGVIFPALGLDAMPGAEDRATCKRYDLLALGLEARDMLPGGPLPGFADYLDAAAPVWRTATWPDEVGRILGVQRKAVFAAALKPHFVARRWLACVRKVAGPVGDLALVAPDRWIAEAEAAARAGDATMGIDLAGRS